MLHGFPIAQFQSRYREGVLEVADKRDCKAEWTNDSVAFLSQFGYAYYPLLRIPRLAGKCEEERDGGCGDLWMLTDAKSHSRMLSHV
jgi:hypothetical protein